MPLPALLTGSGGRTRVSSGRRSLGFDVSSAPARQTRRRTVRRELKGIVGYLRSRALQGKWEQHATFDLEP